MAERVIHRAVLQLSLMQMVLA